MIRCWGGVGDSGQAQEVFDEMLERGHTADLLTWNSVLHSLCKGGKVDEAYELFRGMRQKGFEPDSYSYSIFIHGSCDANDIHTAFRVLDSMRRYNLVPNVFTYNCIIKKLCKNDKINEAYELLDKMLERGVKPDTWSYSTILAFHCDHTEVNRALKLILSMDRDKCERDSHTYNMVLKMLNHLYEKYRDQGLEILAFPCNQFVEEEPGSNDQILDFVCTRLKSEFSIFGKIELNGDNAAPLYKFLKSGKWGIFGNDIKWNFANFLVDKNGQPVGRYYPTTSPLTIEFFLWFLEWNLLQRKNITNDPPGRALVCARRHNMVFVHLCNRFRSNVI